MYPARRSEDAVEYNELDTFLRLKESYEPFSVDKPAPVVQPLGVPGVASPFQMTPERLRSVVLASPSSSLKSKSLPANKKEGEFDVSKELVGFGLQGVNVTDDELRDLVAELGLGEDEAGDLVKGLSVPTKVPTKVSTVHSPGVKSEKVLVEKLNENTTENKLTVE
jgi:hypothetical protein